MRLFMLLSFQLLFRSEEIGVIGRLVVMQHGTCRLLYTNIARNDTCSAISPSFAAENTYVRTPAYFPSFLGTAMPT